MNLTNTLSSLVLVLYASVASVRGLEISAPEAKAVGSKGEPSLKADPVRLERHVRTLATEFIPRDFYHPENQERASAWLEARFKEAGAKVSFQAFQVNGQPYRNVLAQVGPSAGPRIVLGAHYDAFRDSPGADDNASGVSVLLELAHLFAKTPPPCMVELVAYVNEEPPTFRSKAMGSYQHAARLAQEGASVLAMLSLDMVGDYSEERPPQGAFAHVRAGALALVGTPTQAELAERVKRLLSPRLSHKVVLVLDAPEVKGIDWSDHRNYWAFGFPALAVTDGAWERTSAYHTKADVPERLDYKGMAKLTEALHAVVLGLGGGKVR